MAKPAPFNPQDSVLRCENVQRYLGTGEMRNHVLRGVDLALESRKVYAIVGPSGCGKSTLLYLLGLLDRPDDGEIYVRGHAMGMATDDERTRIRNENIGFVFQFHFLIHEFKAIENVMLPMWKRAKLSREEMRAKALNLLKAVGLGEKAERLATQLSGGEQQRVAIARALANDPFILLADEPTGNLDMRNSEMAFDLLYRLSHEKDQATLIVTHNMALAERCDAILRMRDGLFVQE